MNEPYSVLILEIPTEPTPGTFRKVRIQLGINYREVDLVTRWLDRLERQGLITPVRIREWDKIEETDDTDDTDDAPDGDDIEPPPSTPVLEP